MKRRLITGFILYIFLHRCKNENDDSSNILNDIKEKINDPMYVEIVNEIIQTIGIEITDKELFSTQLTLLTNRIIKRMNEIKDVNISETLTKLQKRKINEVVFSKKLDNDEKKIMNIVNDIVNLVLKLKLVSKVIVNFAKYRLNSSSS